MGSGASDGEYAADCQLARAAGGVELDGEAGGRGVAGGGADGVMALGQRIAEGWRFTTSKDECKEADGHQD